MISFTQQFPCWDLKMIEPWRAKCRLHHLDLLKNWRILCLNCVISHYTHTVQSLHVIIPKRTAILKIWRTLLGNLFEQSKIHECVMLNVLYLFWFLLCNPYEIKGRYGPNYYTSLLLKKGIELTVVLYLFWFYYKSPS